MVIFEMSRTWPRRIVRFSRPDKDGRRRSCFKAYVDGDLDLYQAFDRSMAMRPGADRA